MTDLKAHTAEITGRLRNIYPEASVELNHTGPFELLVASVLAAQNTDVNVNKVTVSLFRKYRQPKDYLEVEVEELEQDIHSTGFFHQKAKSIRAISQFVIDNYEGELPRSMAEMLKLPGVGRKTANVVLGEAMGIASGIVVDTHNIRLSGRLGISDQKIADKIEKELMVLVPKEDWIQYGQLITWHGRRVCKAKTPLCSECVLNDICPSASLGLGS